MNRPTDPESLLANTGFVRALARSLLSDEHAAEDVVQDTWVVALSAQDQPRSTLRSWLGGIARHLALQAVRRRERRLRREEAAARPEAELPAAAVVERWDLLRRVVAAVDRLDEPYRTAVLLRYLDGISPPGIARRLGVPLETVRTRLKRALAQLRAQFDHDHGGDRRAWTLALLPLTDPRTAAGLGTAAYGMRALFAGTLLMTLKTKLTLTAGLVLASAALTWTGITVLAPGAPATSTSAAAPATALASQPATQVARTEGPASVPAPALTVIHGRCVAAETKTPLAGCKVALHALSRDSADGRHPGGDPPAQHTGTDGRFRIEFVPHARATFALDVRRDDRCPAQGTWPELTAGKEVDVGDVLLSSGARVSGRVTERTGAPVAKTLVQLHLPDSVPDGVVGPRTGRGAETGAGGAFVFGALLQPGTWSVSVLGELDLVSPRELVVLPNEGEVVLDMVVARPDPAALVAGVVKDETGAPVPDMTLRAWSTGGGASGLMEGKTDVQGAFTVRRRGEDTSPVRLQSASTPGYEAIDERRTFAWGTTGVELVARRTAGVNLVVLDAETEVPVTDFGVRCRALHSRAWQTEGATRLQGHHDNGRIRVPGVGVGAHVLMVFPGEKEPYLPSAPLSFEATAVGTAPITVRLQHTLPLRIQLVHRDGRPASGSKLRLVQPWGHRALDLDASTTSLDLVFKNAQGDPMAIVLGEAVTDASGHATLSGPCGRAGIALQLLGPGHVPRLVADVAVAREAEPRTIVVDAGATLRGHLLPRAAIARLSPREREGQPPSFTPGLRLRNVETPNQQLPPRDERRYVLPGDGQFTIDGIAPGNWEVLFEFWEGGGVGYSPHYPSIAVVRALQEGEVRELDLDASGLLPSRLKVRVLLEGEPCIKATIGFQRALADGKGGKVYSGGAPNMATDAEGRFELEVLPGFYKLFLMPGSSRAVEVRLATDDWVWAEPGKEVEHVARFAHRQATVRILARDGVTPMKGRPFFAANDDFWWWRGETDEQGVLVVDPAPAAPFDVWTFPAEIDDAAQRRLTPAERDRLRTVFGRIQMPPGSKQVQFTLREQ